MPAELGGPGIEASRKQVEPVWDGGGKDCVYYCQLGPQLSASKNKGEELRGSDDRGLDTRMCQTLQPSQSSLPLVSPHTAAYKPADLR